MKTNSKRFLKGALAMLLAVVMLFGTTLTGFAAVVDKAETSVNHTGGYVYFLKPSTWTESKVMMFIGHDSYTSVYEMTLVSNTDNLYRYTMPSWNGATYVAFANASSVWGSGNWGPSNRTNATHYTNVYNNYGFNSGSYYVCVPASTSNNAGLSINYKSSASALNLTTTATACYADAGSTTYKTGTAGGTSTVKGYYMSAYNTASTRSASASATLAPGSTATFTATPATGYEFVGWSTSSSESGIVSTDTTYNFKYDISYTGKTLYALFKQAGYSYTVTAGEGGSVNTTGGTGTSATITATPADGYEFAGWEVTGSGSVADASAASTTLTINANGVVAHATFVKKTYTVKFTDINGNQIGSTQTVEHGATPTAPTAPEVTGKTFAGWTPAVGAVTGDTTYKATYTDNTYSITVNQTGGTGTVNLGKTSAKYGDTVTLKVTPPANYKIASITGGGLNIGECESYDGSFTMPASNVTITVNYALAGTCAPHFALGDQTLVLGATVTNTASTNEYCDDAPDSTFTYKSSDTTVATVNSTTGLVTAKKPGTTTITATCSCGTTATYKVTVKSPSVSVPALTVAVNGTATAKPAITDGPASGYTITYSSSSTDFSVTADGTVTGIMPGTSAVNYTMTYGGNEVATGSFNVTVSTPTYTINPLSENLLVGQTMTDAFVTSSTPAAQSVTLTSNATNVATISGNKATAKGAGTATITASFKYNNSYTATATAKVIVAAAEITADPTSVALEYGEGSTTTSKTVTLDTNAAAGNGTGDDITVSTANANVATATLNGSTITITAKAVGSTTVTAKFHDAEVEIPVTVSKYDPYVYLYVTDSQGWDNMFLHSWDDNKSGVGTSIGQTNAQMIYIGRNGDNAKIFAYKFLKDEAPAEAIVVKANNWNVDNKDRTDDYTLDFSKGYQALYVSSSTNSAGRRQTGDWTDDCMIVRPTVSVADVVVPVASTETATATVTNGETVYWTIEDTTKATVADVTTATTTVTGKAVGDTTITARAFIDTKNSSIKSLPTNYKTDTACWDFISTAATATVTVGSVDYDITADATYSENGTDYNAGTNGGTVTITVDGEDLGTSASVAHGSAYTLTATPAENYRFVGWYNGDTQVSTDATYTVSATAAVDYTAKFVKTHKVSVILGEGIELIKYNNVSYNENFDNLTVDAGASITVYASPAVDYKFKDWTVVGATVDDPTLTQITISDIQSSLTLTANAVPVYTATATAQTNKYYGTYGGAVTIDGQSSPVQYEAGDTVTFEAHENTNYYFAGWYSDKEFETLVSEDATYQTTMTADGITLYGLFVKRFYITNSDGENIAELVYDIATDTYTATSDFADHFKVTSDDGNYVTDADVKVTTGNHVGCTVAGHYTSYQVTADLDIYDPSKGVSYELVSNGNGTYTMNITLQKAVLYNIYYMNGDEKVLIDAKPEGREFTLTVNCPTGKYLLGASSEPAVDLTVVSDDKTITFTMPASDITVTPQFANYSYVKLSDNTGITATGLKSGYKAGEKVEITLAATTAATTISDVTADLDSAVITNNNGTWTITIASMPADTTVTLTPVVDAKFVMDYDMKAIGNYGTGFTSYGTVSMKIGDTTLAKGGYAGPTDTVTYTATPNANFIFDGWYSDPDCEKSHLLSRDKTYQVAPTTDTTVFALFVAKHYMAYNEADTNTYVEMTYNPDDRAFTHESSTISKNAWFRVTNNRNGWSDSDSYHAYSSPFNVTMNSKSYELKISWGTGGSNAWVLNGGSYDYPYTFILTVEGNTSVDISATTGEIGNIVFLSSGHVDIVNGGYDSAVFDAVTTITTEGVTLSAEKTAAHDGVTREKYHTINLTEAQSISFQTEIKGTAAGRYSIDSYVLYDIDDETYDIITPISLGNNKFSGSAYIDGPCYICPVYFVTDDYAKTNGLANIDIYFDASAIQNKEWGPFVACYAWGTNSTDYLGGWSGQMMIPTADGKSFYTQLTVPAANATTRASIPNGVTFNNYMQATCVGNNSGAFGISATQYQCYDYREPITLYEAGYDVITFVAKDSADGYHGDRANGVTANTVSSSTTDIFNKYKFDYLYSRDGVTPMDFNGNVIENPVDLAAGNKADYYVINKGDITYDPNGTKYVGDSAYDADWSVDWYIFDNTGKFITNILSTAMWHDKDGNLEDLHTYLHDALGTNKAGVAGKTVAISYEHENNAGHQVSYDGQWYGNYLQDKVKGQVKVGFQNADGTFTVNTNEETPNIADYGEGYLVDSEGAYHQTLEILIDHGIADLHAVKNDGYAFVGWFTQLADGSYKQISTAFDYSAYINLDETYYAMFRTLGETEVVINHLVYNNPNDPDIPSHGGVSEMYVEVRDAKGALVASGTPSTTRSFASFECTEGEEYEITIKTTPLMNGEFYAWYTDSYTADGTKTFEEILVEPDMVNSTSPVSATFSYVYDVNDPVKTINIYSDIFRVSNKADFIYKYYNRFGAVCTYTVRDVLLTDDECLGYYGNEGNAYYPTYLTAYTMDNGKGEVTVYGEDRYNEYINNGYSLVDSYNKVQAYAPSADVTEAFDQNINWVVEGAVLTPAKSQVTLWANQVPAQYTITYTMPDANNGLVEGTFSDAGYYNELTEITAPQTNANGEKFSYWYEPATGQILSYFLYYNYRIVENKTIEAVYGKEVQDWTPSINSVTYTREYQDTSDIIYTDFLLAYNSKDGLVLNDVKEEMNIQYGLLMVMDPTYSYNGEGEVEFLDPTEANLKTAALYGKNKLIDGIRYYNFDLTSYDLTNFNRCDYFKSFNNKDTTNNFKGVAYTCVAYIIVDGTVYLSDSVDVNFYDLATTPVEQLNN